MMARVGNKARGSGFWVLGKRGQSILEYLMIVTLIVIAFVAIKGTVAGHLKTLYGHTTAKVQKTAASFAEELREIPKSTTGPEQKGGGS